MPRSQIHHISHCIRLQKSLAVRFIGCKNRSMRKPLNTKNTAPPKRPRGRPVKGTAGIVTTRVLDAATHLFLRNGFAETSMDMVAADAGSSKRTLYSRFPSKGDLFNAVVLRFAAERLAQVEISTKGVGSLKEMLHAAAEKIVEIAISEQGLNLQRLLYREGHKFPELASIVEAVGREPSLQIIMRILRQEQTTLGTDEDLHFLALQFITLTTTLPVRTALTSGQEVQMTEKMRAELHRSVDFFIRGCGLA
jgi:TetR/AcrR family transcriptional repressor of mexJK operon